MECVLNEGIFRIFGPFLTLELSSAHAGGSSNRPLRRSPKKAMEIGLSFQDTAGFRFRHASGMGRMSVRVSCHKCSATLKVDDDFVGRNVICPSCRSSVRIEKSTGDRQSDGSNGAGTNASPAAKFVSVQVPADTTKKKRKGRTSKRKQKARATRSRNPVRVFAFLLIAAIGTWFAFLRPTDRQIGAVAPSPRAEAAPALNRLPPVSSPTIGALSASQPRIREARFPLPRRRIPMIASKSSGLPAM